MLPNKFGNAKRMFMKYSHYLDEVNSDLWNWADLHHRDELDGGSRGKRPPVLSKRHASKGVIIPPDDSIARRVRAAIPERQRHRWFGSLKSSQALSQSVFGAVRAFERLDLLQYVFAECGRPAFFTDHRGFALKFERSVNWLGGPRPTSVDVMACGPLGRIAIECKFTEREFGTCSRPRLDPKNERYATQHCDGNYRVQRNRLERCALTEIGIRYWEYLPHLFDWPADRDHEPCPFGGVYQLARNALAAAVTPEGALEDFGGHVLVVYDARNPEFQANGKAGNQWRFATAACRVPGLLRRLSWQRLVAELSRAQELMYLVEAMRRKYGITPE